MSENQEPEGAEAEAKADEGDKQEQQTITQADLDKVVAKVRAEERRKASERFADYDDLKAKAGEKATAEERIAALENEIGRARLDAARAQIANEFGLTERQAAALKYAPSEEEAREIAEGLAAEASERKRNNNVVPREGTNSRPAEDKEAAARAFFGV